MAVKSFDGISIGYDACGSGPPILLLHGFNNDRSMWSKTGWTDRLKTEFTVVTMDFRGSGTSGKPVDPDAYSIEAHCEDIDSVLAACGMEMPTIWGWSLGATVALHYAKRGPVRRTVAAGTYFGPIFTDEYIDRQLMQTTDTVTKSRLNGLRKWPLVRPGDIRTPFLVYTGTEDGNVVIQIRRQKQEIEHAGGMVRILENVNHNGLVNAVSKVEDLVLPFIKDT